MKRLAILLLAALPLRGQQQPTGVFKLDGSDSGGGSVSLTCTVPLACTPSPITGTGDVAISATPSFTSVTVGNGTATNPALLTATAGVGFHFTTTAAIWGRGTTLIDAAIAHGFAIPSDACLTWSSSTTDATAASDSSVCRFGAKSFYFGVAGDATGTLTAANFVGNASTASALAADPTDCSAGQFANAIAANGNLTCATPGIPAGSGTTITDNSATIFAKVAVPSGSTYDVLVIFRIEGKNGTDWTSLPGNVTFNAVNKAGTITCVVGTPVTTTNLGTGGATSSLTAFTCSDAGSNVLNLSVNATTSLTDSAGWPKIIHTPLSTSSATYTAQ